MSLILAPIAMSAQQRLQSPENTIIRCATDEYNAQLLQTNPRMMGSQAYEELMAPKIATIKAQLAANPNRALQFTIPVVVHVIHNGEPVGVGANISDAQVISQIQVMNEDFRRIVGSRGFNSHPDGADIEVEFCLAKQTPDGCVTNGIDRIDMSAVSTSWSGPGGNTDTVLKPATFWDASQYMNMWSVNFSNGNLLGFAQFPGGPANSDGVVSNYTYFGSNDAAGVTIGGVFNLGRTMTHEVGHYLGLYHTFQGGCADGDVCADTPAISGPNGGCPTIDSCAGGAADMVENYMDYTNDSCMNVFTNDQKARVINTMTNSANRPNTTTSNVCTELASVNDDGSIEINSLSESGGACSGELTPNVRITNWGTATLTSATVSYDIDGGASTNSGWSGSLAYGEFEDFDLPVITASSGSHTFNVAVSAPNGGADLRACNDTANADFSGSDSYSGTTEVRLSIIPDNYGSEITWSFSDENGVLFSGGPYTDGNSTQIDQTFLVNPDICYSFVINDGFGDGICCDWGNGSYNLRTDDDTIIFSGGDFSDSETTQISTYALSTEDYFGTNGISLYPNPTTTELNIKLGNANDLPSAYEIFNVLGQSISRKTIATNADLTINSSELSNGMYFIRISKNDASITLPFIKK